MSNDDTAVGEDELFRARSAVAWNEGYVAALQYALDSAADGGGVAKPSNPYECPTPTPPRFEPDPNRVDPSKFTDPQRQRIAEAQSIVHAQLRSTAKEFRDIREADTGGGTGPHAADCGLAGYGKAPLLGP